MAFPYSEVTGRTFSSGVEPLAVSPRQACILLGIGNTRLYQLIGNHELESYTEGRARRITMESIRRRVAGLLVDANAPSRHRKNERQSK
jgi:excisionase family DNA binding protein